MKKILIIEDDFAIRQGVEFALRHKGYEVMTLAEGSKALATIRAYHPDLVLLDIMLPEVDGFTIAKELRSEDTTTGLIIMSALGETPDKVKGLTLGADDYIEKPFELDELLARIEANLRRQPADTSTHAVYDTGDLVVDTAKHTVTVAGAPLELRPKEFDLLVTLLAAHGEVCTRAFLAERVWGYAYLATSRSLDVHIRRLRQVIEEPSAYRYIKTVHGVGYRIEAEHKTGEEPAR